MYNSVDSELHFDRYIGHVFLSPSNSLERDTLHLSTKIRSDNCETLFWTMRCLPGKEESEEFKQRKWHLQDTAF